MQKIRRSKMIKGIEIEYNGSQEIKVSQYADDTTALLSDTESVIQLFELLGFFERCSGLKINESKSELLSLGSWRHRKDKLIALKKTVKHMVSKGHICLRQNKSSEIPRALQTGIYLQCNGNSKTFC